LTVDIRIGDCRHLLAAVPDESVHCVVTSPPYFGLRDYGVAGQIGLEPTPDAFVAEMVAVFREVRRVLRSDGTCWLNLGDSYCSPPAGNKTPSGVSQTRPSRLAADLQTYNTQAKDWGGLPAKNLLGIPWRVAFALQADGWYLRQDIIWSKPNPMPESVTDRCTKAHEYLFLLSKSARYWYDADAIKEEPAPYRPTGKNVGYNEGNADPKGGGFRGSGGLSEWRPDDNGRNKRSVWTVATQPFSEAHFATFPHDLIEPCIKAGCPKQCCAKCGAPWDRVVERTPMQIARSERTHEKGHTRASGTMTAPPTSTTLGFQPSCACNAATVPGAVLDPFGGAGTTGLVADRLGRNAILLELNPTYAEMARRRISNDAGMFAEVAAQ
jgi:DNA modification methylase